MRIPGFSSSDTAAQRKPPTSAAGHHAARPYVLDCRIESGAHLYYEIQQDGRVQHVEEPMGGVMLVSAVYAPPGRADDDTADDYRFSLPKKMASAQASRYIQRELGLFHKLRSIVSSSGGHMAWAVVEEKVLSKGHIQPFALPLERLMAQDGLIPPCVTGVLFGESELLVLMAFPGNGRTYVQTSVSPDNLTEIISSFSALNSISVQVESVPIYTGSEFLLALKQAPAYPRDTEFLGLPVSWLARVSLTLSVCALLGSCASYFYIAQQLHAVRGRLVAWNRQTQDFNAATVSRLESNPESMGTAMSVDYAQLFAHAAQFWVPGGRVESEADAGRETHTLILPLQDKQHPINQSDMDRALASMLPDVPSASELPHANGLPDACHAVGYTLSSTASELRMQYVCDRGTDALAMMETHDEAH